MTIYDAAMAIVVVLGMIRGAWRGFTWQLASLASLVLGYTAAHTGSAQFAAYLPGEPEVQRAMAMALVYIAVSGGIFGVAWMIRGSLRKLRFEAYDRHLGLVLGGTEGLGVGMLATLLVVSVAPATRQPIFSSPTGQVVGLVMDKVGPVLPHEVRKVLEPVWDGSSTVRETLASQSPDAAGALDSIATELPAPHEAASAPGQTALALPALPPLEGAPGDDPAVQPVRGAPTSPLPHRESARDTARELKSIASQGRKEIEQAVAETLDAAPGSDGKASSLRQLADKEKKRAEQAIRDLKASKQKAGGQVKDRVSQAQRQVGQALADTIDKGHQEIGKAVGDALDEQLQRLGGLESAPQKGPK